VKSDEPAVGPAGCALIISSATSGACGGGGRAVVSMCMRGWVFKRLESGERRQHVLATTRVHSKSVDSSELIGDHTSSSELIGENIGDYQSSSELIRAHQSSSELIRAMGEAIRAHQRGHQRPSRLQSEVIRGPHPKPSPASAH
jgi:hypothetical protein